MSVAYAEPLAPQLQQRGGSADLVADEYMHIITDAITNAPRSLQTKVGPSELGHPCKRRLGYKMLGQPEREGQPNWKATIGTGAHMWLETAFDGDNLRYALGSDGQERWLIETKVSVGEVNGQEITGSCDLYDRVTATVIDHKTVGPTQLKKYKASGPGQQYRAQAHLYGRGWLRAGLPVDTVMIVFLPRNGELHEAYAWHEPFNEQVALDTLERATGINVATTLMGHASLPMLETADAFCTYCPYFKAGSQNLADGCPGDPGAASRNIPTSDAPFGAVATQGALV